VVGRVGRRIINYVDVVDVAVVDKKHQQHEHDLPRQRRRRRGGGDCPRCGAAAAWMTKVEGDSGARELAVVHDVEASVASEIWQ